MKSLFAHGLAIVALILSGSLVADEHSGDKGARGKEKAAEMKEKHRGGEKEATGADARDDAADAAEDAAEREEEAREEARERDEEAQEREQEAAEEDDQATDGPKKGKGEMPPGLEKRDGAPQAGKGSEKGQQMREEKSRAWWKFWEE